ncbi:MAG: extracellular solute-binding protein [Prochloraceae cyanobacterium]
MLRGSIPPQLLGEFSSTLAEPSLLKFTTKAQLEDLLTLLQSWQELAKGEETNQGISTLNRSQLNLSTDLVTLGDYWLTEVIKKKLIQPLEIKDLEGWSNLPSICQQLVKRNEDGDLDEGGSIWGAPYRWGSTLIAYRRDKFEKLGWMPRDWRDLWREELRDRLSLLDQPREVIGLTLKKLGYSYNTLDLNKIPSLKSELLALDKQVKFYASRDYLQPLILGDTWLAVGWSGDILPIQATIPQIEAVIPLSGTALWADLWVKPADSEASSSEGKKSLIKQWIDFCWQLIPASKISLLTNAASPIVAQIEPEELIKDILDNPLLRQNRSILEKSEFIHSLPESVEQQYIDLWKQVRTAQN